MAGVDAARAWLDAHPGGDMLGLAAAFELGCGATAPLAAASAGR